ncbi:polysaccharide biosynthesis/export family protein [Sphingomonas desiccabilis]|uniref:Polysaccharide export protein n=1 Tax=Sphingomonas desiccabilis TaxID=429134 RepID=A0A4Q2ISP4_9SPHN|nr:polysaccharide biosynthesis/export family protein [Sphingomonas desiccabilis]MBB3911835.1 polysaccharide export outer membrane protein [Sphingomonas desiccabilis]RXZ31450.1 polysaccharide export protein [Sphingomonas desiccabilis]
MRTRSTRAAIALLLLVATPVAAQVAAPPQQGALAAAADYRLGSGDRLRISVYDEEGMTGEYQVSELGIISFPLIGDYPAGGKTVPQLRADLERRLGSGLLNDPKVTAEVIAFRPFYILGEVNKPGTYPYTPGLTLYHAVATAQGFTYRANSRKVMITRAGETKETKVEVTAATRIQPGDTIRVREKIF